MTIRDALKIKIEKRNSLYYADARVLSGSPPVGIGANEHEALYDLLAKLMWMVAYGDDSPSRGHLEQWQTALQEYFEQEIIGEMFKTPQA